MYPVFVGAVVLIDGIAELYVAVTFALCPPVPPFALNDTVYVLYFVLISIPLPAEVTVTVYTPSVAVIADPAHNTSFKL